MGRDSDFYTPSEVLEIVVRAAQESGFIIPEYDGQCRFLNLDAFIKNLTKHL